MLGVVGKRETLRRGIGDRIDERSTAEPFKNVRKPL
jgi:hypothetical protein